MFPIFLDFFHDPLRSTTHPIRILVKKRMIGIKEAVADIIHHIKQLSGGTVRQLQLKIQNIVAPDK